MPQQFLGRGKDMGEMSSERRFLEYVQDTALPELKKGNALYANILQKVFLLPGEWELQVEIAAAYEEVLLKISAKKLIRLSEECRIYYDGWYAQNDALEWSVEKPQREEFPYLTDGQYEAVLKFGTFMRCGYDRQWCMEALDGADGSLLFFFLRLNDWVGAIRESAFFLAKKRLPECGAQEFFSALPMLEKVRDSGRRDEEHIQVLEGMVKEQGLGKLQKIPDGVLVGRLPYFEINVKNAVYRLVSQNKVLPLWQMERLLSAEWTGYGKQLLLSGIFLHYGYDEERAGRYLASASALVRYRALLFRYENEKGAWAGLEKMLLDRSRRIRRYASYILETHTDMDVLVYYVERLGCLRRGISGGAEPGTDLQREHPVPLWIVLLGIGEHGTKKEIALVTPFLESEDTRTAKAALTAYGRFAAEEGENVYWKFLFDDRPAVAKTAYRLIQKYKLHYGAELLYREFCGRRLTVCGNYLFRLLLSEPSWERLPYLLKLYGEGELSREQRVRVWDGIHRRYVYAVVSVKQAQAIREALERVGEKIPEQSKKGILFDLDHVCRHEM